MNGVGEAGVDDDEAPTSPEESLMGLPNVNANATSTCECEKITCELCSAKTLHCDTIEDMEERVYCVEDTNRIVLPPCNFVTKEGRAMAAMELDEEFKKKTMEAKHQEQQELIEIAVEAAHSAADVNENGSIEPTELHSLVSVIAGTDAIHHFTFLSSSGFDAHYARCWPDREVYSQCCTPNVRWSRVQRNGHRRHLS